MPRPWVVMIAAIEANTARTWVVFFATDPTVVGKVKQGLGLGEVVVPTIDGPVDILLRIGFCNTEVRKIGFRSSGALHWWSFLISPSSGINPSRFFGRKPNSQNDISPSVFPMPM